MNWLDEKWLTLNNSSCHEVIARICESQTSAKSLGWKNSKVFHYSPRLCIQSGLLMYQVFKIPWNFSYK